MDLVVPDPSLSLNQGAIEPWTKPKHRPLGAEMKRYARSAGIPLDTPWRDLSKEHRDILIEGDSNYDGVRGFFNHLERKKYKLHVRVFLSRYRGYSQCSSCGGARLRTEARHVLVDGKNICEVTAMTVEEATNFFSSIQLTRGHCRQAARRNSKSAALPQRSWTRIPQPRPPRLDAQRR
jgi:excinuclease ABC subunit A